MVRSVFIFLVMFTLFSCNNTTTLNENLIGFKATEIGEPGYKIGFGKYHFNLKKIQANYLDDIIIIKTLNEVNACGKYKMDIDFQNDTILLKYDFIKSKLCKSLRIDELTYIVNNPKKKKWKIISKSKF